jgi:biopolymer transport protein ExbD
MKKKKSLDSIFLDIMMVLLVVLIIMLASVRVSENERITEQIEENEVNETIELNSSQENSKAVDQSLIITYNHNRFDIRFKEERRQISNKTELQRVIQSIVGSNKPEVILLVSPQLNIRQAMNLMDDLSSVVTWTDLKIGIFE